MYFLLLFFVSLYAFKDIEMFRILICGGDGTVGWVLSCLDDTSSLLKCKKPPSAVVPLGTGRYSNIGLFSCILYT